MGIYLHAKLRHGHLITAKENLPTEEAYIAAGYKKAYYTAPPETDEGYHAEPGWEEQGENIVQVWEIVKDPDDIDEAEAFDIIFGGAE